jgi:hypothetical protein
LKQATKVRHFLLKALSRESLIFLFFVVVATGFWLLQTLDNDYEMTVDIPVRLKNVPDDVVITAEPVKELHVKVKDKGPVLLNYMLGKRIRPISIDFREHKSDGNVVGVPSSVFEREIQNRLNISTKQVSVSPDTVDYVYAANIGKRVKVIADGDIRASRQYYVSDTIYSPDSVLVFAPQYMLDTITAVKTEQLDITDISETVAKEVSIVGAKGMKFVPDRVKLTCKVDVYAEKTIEVPVTGVGFPSDMTLRAFPSTVKVTFVVGLDKFSSIKASDFIVAIPYDELINSGNDKFKVRVQSFPDNVSLVRVSPEYVDFLIER